MGDYIKNLAGNVPGVSDLGSLDIIGLIKSKIFGLLPESAITFYEAHKVLCLLGIVCVLVLLAVRGYKIFKGALYAGGAFAFAYVGFKFLAPRIPENIKAFVPEQLEADVLVAVLCALVAVFLTRCAYSFMISILGGAAGYLLGTAVIYKALLEHFNTLGFLQNNAVKYIIGGIFAAMFAILFILLFKHVFMVVSSFGGSIGAALALQAVVMPAGGKTIQIAFAVLGAAFGIYCIVRQYKQEEKDLEIVY